EQTLLDLPRPRRNGQADGDKPSKFSIVEVVFLFSPLMIFRLLVESLPLKS
ncbi:unnamed protein product, partial [Amoebophrya sp. A120]